MHRLIKDTGAQDLFEYVNRRSFIERFVIGMGVCPLALRFWGHSALAAAQSDSGNIESAAVKYPGDGVGLQGYLSRPKEKGPYPGVIVVHHNLGLIEHFRDVSRRLASQGYLALAVDLLSRQGGTAALATPDAVTKAFQNEHDELLISDLDAAYRYLNSNSAVKDDIAILGFAAGAQKAFLYVTANPKLRAAVIFYGSAPPDDRLARIQCPVLEIVGDKDTRFAPAVPVIQEKMKQLGKSYEWKIYPGADHDFFENTDPRYNEVAAKESWTVALDFLKRNLG